MVRWLCLVALAALAGCSSGATYEPGAPAIECDIDPQIADAANEAIQLWADAAGTAIPLPSRIELADFGDDEEHAAAWSEEFDVLQVSSRTAPEKRASSIAHELGHSLGLEHEFGTGNLMDPDRPTAARLRPCISAATIAAAGFTGAGACVR